MHRIACYTLFDITKTGVLNRARPGDDVTDTNDWYRKRSTQCNFDTVLQVISLRAQPDIISDPERLEIDLNASTYFGNELKNETVPMWKFMFEVQHQSVFEDGINELGALYKDCSDVPMIQCDSQWHKAGDRLDITMEKRNIYFVKYEYE
jgi:hypothetical protein